jgi:hypothetical protein
VRSNGSNTETQEIEIFVEIMNDMIKERSLAPQSKRSFKYKNIWYRIWNNLRFSSTERSVDWKLAILIESGFQYGKYLRSCKKYWVVFFFTWEVTFGCESTQLMEGVFNSLKSKLGKNKLFHHEVAAAIYFISF